MSILAGIETVIGLAHTEVMKIEESDGDMYCNLKVKLRFQIRRPVASHVTAAVYVFNANFKCVP